MENCQKELELIFGTGRVTAGEPLDVHTSLKIGGSAALYIEVESVEDLVKAVQFAKEKEIAFLVIGGGTHICISEKGFDGLVIKNNCRKFDMMSMSGRVRNGRVDIDKTLIFAESGVITNQLVRFSIDRGLSGLEYQLGLPGTIGGAVAVNAGLPLKNVYVGEYVYKARLLTKSGEIKDVDRTYFRFGYDHNVNQSMGEVILSLVFKLEPEDKKMLWEKATEALEHRTSIQPKSGISGCTFRAISALETMYKNPKVSPVSLIEKAGLDGLRVGDAMISAQHPDFFINMGKATSRDMLALVKKVKDEVFQKFGVNLQINIKIIGS